MLFNFALPALLFSLQLPPAAAADTSVRKVALASLESPNVHIDEQLRLAQSDTGLSVSALIAAGAFEAARDRLEASDSTAMWIVAAFDYWNATADRSFLRSHWPQLTRAFHVSLTTPQPDSLAWLMGLEGMSAMARVVPDQATARRADSLLQRANAVEFTPDTVDAAAHYALHRGWAGYGGLQSGQRSESASVLAIMRGLIGWYADAPNRAAGLEPHMPAEWRTFRVQNLRVGRDRVDARLRREAGSYEIHLERKGRAPGLALRLAPALPLGARVRSVIVNDRDVPVHVEESLHDTHVVIETTLDKELNIEIDYEGGFDLHVPSPGLEVVDFRRAHRGYAVLVQGLAGTTHFLTLYSEPVLHQITGAEIIEQDERRVLLRVTFPPGEVLLRREIHVRP